MLSTGEKKKRGKSYQYFSYQTCSLGGFIAQSVEHRTGIAEVMGSTPLKPQNFFLGFVCNCLSSDFTTANITFSSILQLLTQKKGIFLREISSDTCIIEVSDFLT